MARNSRLEALSELADIADVGLTILNMQERLTCIAYQGKHDLVVLSSMY